MAQFRVTYTDGHDDELVEAEKYEMATGEWYVFRDAEGAELLKVRQSTVRSIGLASARPSRPPAIG
jgi:NADPH-dependent ferric siderophore reductase